MHVMIQPRMSLGQTYFSAVAFELNGSVLEPHELLQYDDRWLDATDHLSVTAHLQHLTDLARFCRRWLGVRGYVWAESAVTLNLLAGDWRCFQLTPGFESKQQLELRAMIWGAAKAARGKFRIPDLEGVGLTPKTNTLHAAVSHAVLLQAAFRALLDK